MPHGRDTQSSQVHPVQPQWLTAMTAGKVSHLVTSYGSMWGRIKPAGEDREVFFNPESLTNRADYPALALGQDVAYDEEPDRANGTHAIHVRAIEAGLPPAQASGETLIACVLWAAVIFVLSFVVIDAVAI
jgi:cold shock CspA family protein